MRKLLVGALIVSLFITGCQTLRSSFCSPTTDEIANGTIALSQVQQMEEFLTSLAPTPSTQAIIAGLGVAVGIYNQIKNGICLPAEQQSEDEMP